MIKAAHSDLRFQAVLAQLFGQKVTASESSCTVTGFSWRGRLFVVSIDHAPVEPPIPPRTP